MATLKTLLRFAAPQCGKAPPYRGSFSSAEVSSLDPEQQRPESPNPKYPTNDLQNQFPHLLQTYLPSPQQSSNQQGFVADNPQTNRPRGRSVPNPKEMKRWPPFGRNVAKFRAERGLSQDKLAEEAALNRTYLSGIERMSVIRESSGYPPRTRFGVTATQ